MKLAPIALFVYNRPDHTRQTLEALLKNELANESDLFIFSDGPKIPAAVELVNKVRDYIKTINGFKSVNIFERDKNLGLANSIIDGVTSLCIEYGQVIVLEDDLVTSPYFLDFTNEALDKYRNDKQVLQISGHMFPTDTQTQSDAFFLPMITSWGWATWQSAWQYFDPTAAGYGTLKFDLKSRRQFNLDGSYDYFGMLTKQLHGKIDSWAIRWYLSFFFRRGLTLFPKNTLVKNIGFDASGIHCKTKHMTDYITQSFRVRNYPDVAINEEAKRAVYAHLFNEAKHNRRFNKVWRKLLKWFV